MFSHRVPLVIHDIIRVRSAAMFATRHFGKTQYSQRLVAKALKYHPPPKLQKTAHQHYEKTLSVDGHKMALRIVEERGATKKGPHELSSDEKTMLLYHHLPDQREVPQILRKKGHKWLWQWMKRREWKKYDACLEELRSRQIPFDEVTYNLAIFGVLLHPRRDDELARVVLNEMITDGKFHPVLIRLQENFLESYFELKELDAAPNRLNLRKTAQTLWHISVNFKRQRIFEFRQRLAEAAAARRSISAEHSGSLTNSTIDLQDEEEMDDGLGMFEQEYEELGPPKPSTARGIYKGSGVPNNRKRWRSRARAKYR